MKLIPIRDLVKKTKQISPLTLGRETFIYVDISSVDKDLKMICNPQSLSINEAPSRARKEIKTGDVLVATVRPNLNSVAIVPSLYNQQIASTGFCVLRADPAQMDPLYLFYFLQTKSFIRRVTNLSNGAGYPAVSDDDILNTEIIYRSLNEQHRIGLVLQKADRLRRLRRNARELSDGYLQSVFLEMFGDPETNPKRCKKMTLKELGRVSTGSTPPSALEGMFGGDIPFITPGDLTVNTLSPKRFLTQKGAEKSEVVRSGSTMVCCIGTIGKMDKAVIKSAFNQQINAVEWSSIINDDYGYYVLQFFKKLLSEKASSTTLPILKKSEFELITIPVPPLDEQVLFSSVVKQYDSLQKILSESERQAEQLFQSLLRQAFE